MPSLFQHEHETSLLYWPCFMATCKHGGLGGTFCVLSTSIASCSDRIFLFQTDLCSQFSTLVHSNNLLAHAIQPLFVYVYIVICVYFLSAELQLSRLVSFHFNHWAMPPTIINIHISISLYST